MLRLKKDLLIELTAGDLAQVAGAAGPESQDDRCATRAMPCATDIVRELTLRC